MNEYEANGLVDRAAQGIARKVICRVVRSHLLDELDADTVYTEEEWRLIAHKVESWLSLMVEVTSGEEQMCRLEMRRAWNDSSYA